MKTDRELLKLAAKAASYKHLRYCEIHMAMVPEPEGEDVLPFSMWNPLTDDGDALRLAVKCSISLNTMLVDGMNRPRHETAACSSYGLPIVHDKHSGDPYAATRRAIVRAAAAIWEQMRD